ncbi:MAG: Sua5/YciO/YrdC/YwlC family protein [Saprospiraceae bacterium]|nr:Sua5/YciO/YrdC/YwlC family protein [Saprospiraceae bacterium]
MTALLDKDGILLLPTDAVWGLCGNALSPVAIHRILKLRQQEPGQGLVILVADLPMLKEYVTEIHPRLETLLALHRRPLTILYPHTRALPDVLCGPEGKWAVRITLDPFLKDLIRAFGKPLVAAIPKTVDDPVPTHFGMISSAFLEQVDYVAKWRRQDKTEGEVSVIAEWTAQNELRFIRS